MVFLETVSITTSSLELGIIYDFAPSYLRERSAYRDQIFTRNKYRAQFFTTLGFKGPLGAQYGYQRYRLQFNSRNTLGALGRLFCEVNARKNSWRLTIYSLIRSSCK